MKLPRKLSHIWIGPKLPPEEWMQSWKEMLPDWSYTLYDNTTLKSEGFETAPQIEEYMRRGKYAGAADLMRYELLWRYGGFMPGADSVCLLNPEPLFVDNAELYTIYENEFVRGKLVSPILAAAPGNSFLRLLIDQMKEVPPETLGEPWKQTGNLFVAQMIEKHAPDIVIWPSHYMIPEHFTGVTYEGDGPIYAHQIFGETNKAYKMGLKAKIMKKFTRHYNKKARGRIDPKMRQ